LQTYFTLLLYYLEFLLCHAGGLEEHTDLCAVAHERDAVSARVRVCARVCA
jgi:hypothetical protein